FGLGMGEIMVILVIALLVLGPAKLPDAAKQIGKAIRELRKHTDNLQQSIEQDEHIGGTVRELKSALRGEEPPFVPPKPAVPPGEAEKTIARGSAEAKPAALEGETKPPEPGAVAPAATAAAVADAKPAHESPLPPQAHKEPSPQNG